MTFEIKGIRPALVGEKSFRLFDNFRAFRHRLRHSYMYDIERAEEAPTEQS